MGKLPRAPWAASSGPRLLINQRLVKGTSRHKNIVDLLRRTYGWEKKKAETFLDIHLMRLKETGVVIVKDSRLAPLKAFGIVLPEKGYVSHIREDAPVHNTLIGMRDKDAASMPSLPPPVPLERRVAIYVKRKVIPRVPHHDQ